MEFIRCESEVRSMNHKHVEIKRAIEVAVAEVCQLPGRGLWFAVDQVEVKGRPAERIRVWATLRFLIEGSPFCCGEPGCHLGLIGDRLAEINARLRSELRLGNQAVVEFGDRVRVDFARGVTFRTNPV